MPHARNLPRTPRTGERSRRSLFLFASVLLAVEFLDELVFGVREAAWPLIRDDLRLSYAQIGVLLSVPGFVGNLVEPSFGILGDVWRRRALVLTGGVVFAAAAVAVGASVSFAALLAATILFNPASGAFVGLSQATLMDAAPERREQNMARWSLAGAVGNAAGPLALGASLASGFGWRSPFYLTGVLSLVLVAVAWHFPFETPAAGEDVIKSGHHERGLRVRFAGGVREALSALRRREVLRWLVLLEVADFTLDILRGYLALYFVDVVGVSESRAALALVAWTWATLPGEALLIPLLARVRGLSYLRASASVVLILFPAFLLARGFAWKVVLLCLLGFVNAGWYAILKARLYAELPERSGTALTLGNVTGLAHDLFPLALGALAEWFGLGAMMWLLAAGPAVMLAGLLTADAGVGAGRAGNRRGTEL
jgi:FSR family fosmidomycin resistance protein-like MFS transporter